MSVLLFILAYILSGVIGALMITAVGLSAKFTLEIVNYMEHYGLVRHPKSCAPPKATCTTTPFMELKPPRKLLYYVQFTTPQPS